VRSYERVGNDPYVGRRLVSLLHDAGAVPRRNTWLFFGSCAGNSTLDGCVTNLAGILSGVKRRLVAAGLVDEPLLDRVLHALEDWKQRKDAAFWFGLPWAEGVRPL